LSTLWPPINVTPYWFIVSNPPRMISRKIAVSTPFFGKHVIAIAVMGVPAIAQTSLMELSAAMRP
jgi:hypothetical protein